MSFSRRKFLRTVGTGAAAVVAAPVLRVQPTFAGEIEPFRASASDGPILLNSNENAYGCSERVLKAIREGAACVTRYPRTEYMALRERLAELHRVTPEQVVLGCGATEIIRMCTLALVGPGNNVIVASPTYEAPARFAKLQGAAVDEVRLNREWAHDLDGMLARVDARTALTYICNPNNPTGSITPRKDIEAFLGKLPPTTYVLIDEAYHHFMNPSGLYASFLDQPVDNPKVIVTRTFSKIYGLAGLRMGYGIAHPELAEKLRSQQAGFSVNVLAARIARVALDDKGAVEEYAKRNTDNRQEFFNQANARMLRAIDSHANFVMLNAGRPADEVIEHFRQHSILVGRKFSPLDDYIRVSLGKPDEMKEFWRTWDLLPGAHHM